MSEPGPAAGEGSAGERPVRENPARDDVLAGGIFIALGLAFALGARSYELGTALKMGPGYVPFVLGGLLALLGIGVIVDGLRLARLSEEDTPTEQAPRAGLPWRAIALMSVAFLVFGAGVRPLGLVPVLLLTTFLAALADRSTSLLKALLIAVALTVACVVIFVVLLQLRLPLLGTALGG